MKPDKVDVGDERGSGAVHRVQPPLLSGASLARTAPLTPHLPENPRLSGWKDFHESLIDRGSAADHVVGL